MSLKGNAIIGQSGGPTIVINASLVGAIQAAWDLTRSNTSSVRFTGWTAS